MPSGVRLPHPFATHGETEQIKIRKFLMGLGSHGLRFSLNFQNSYGRHIIKILNLVFLSHNAWLPWQPATKIEPSKHQNNKLNLAKITVFFLLYTYEKYLFRFQYKL